MRLLEIDTSCCRKFSSQQALLGQAAHDPHIAHTGDIVGRGKQLPYTLIDVGHAPLANTEQDDRGSAHAYGKQQPRPDAFHDWWHYQGWQSQTHGWGRVIGH